MAITKSRTKAESILERIQTLDEVIDEQMHEAVYAAWRGWRRKATGSLETIRAAVDVEIQRLQRAGNAA